jgi:hypothetical protein
VKNDMDWLVDWSGEMCALTVIAFLIGITVALLI